MQGAAQCMVTLQQDGPGFKVYPGPFCVEFACSPRVSAWVSSANSGLLPQFKEVQVG
uniref:Uncharacterized protein n=1 Tax=Anguilla anguilla TaxID=7936 RepID=A0A0E9W1X0_ANGAN